MQSSTRLEMGTKNEMGSETKLESPPFYLNERIRKAQKAVSSQDWTSFKLIFEGQPKDLLEDFDLYENTAINVATRSNDPQLLRYLLEMLPTEEDRGIALTRGNCRDHTLLHEVALHKAVEMADVVFDFERKATPPPLTVKIKNRKGETPLFLAAKVGNLKMVKRMAKHVAEQNDGDVGIHLRRPKQTILHATVNAQFFDIALWIMTRLDGARSLAQEKDEKGLTCLQILARMPHAFRSYYSLGCFNNLLYNMLPEEGYEIEDCDSYGLFGQKTDLETGQHDDARPPTSGVSRINYTFWKYLAEVFPWINSLWKKKKKHILAKRLAELFVKDDFTWAKSYNFIKKSRIVLPSVPYNVAKLKKQVERKEKKKQEQEDLKDNNDNGKPKQHHYYNYSSLLVAASNGIIEIVELFLKEHPEAVHHVSEDEENLLHMAVKHRQIEIYRLLKKNLALNSLASRISDEDRTILHQVARMDYYKATHLAGAAFQLQAELKWYKRVEKVIPSRFYMHCDQQSLTANDVLEIEHDDMLKDAQAWIKGTAQSCSTVAVLVATVVFTAAYTIPGGTQSGAPILLQSPVFIFFTIMDVVALALSLASVVMFLSILTSPFELWDFHKSLPRKLNLGFAFLFLSLTATMLAFSATILMTIRLQWKDWPSTLVYTAAFFPVSMIAMVEFPLYTKLSGLLKKMYKKVIKKVYKKVINVVPVESVIKYCFKRRVE